MDSAAVFIEEILANKEAREWLSVSVMHDRLSLLPKVFLHRESSNLSSLETRKHSKNTMALFCRPRPPLNFTIALFDLS